MVYLIITSIATILENLHWLPDRRRIHFKIVVITYTSINEMAPEYLCELLSIRKSSRKFRSSSQILMQVPVSLLMSYSDCAFTVQPPTLWNWLQLDIINAWSLEHFKSVLKPTCRRLLSQINNNYIIWGIIILHIICTVPLNGSCQ